MHSPIEHSGIFRCQGYVRMERKTRTYTYLDRDEEICSLVDLYYAPSWSGRFARLQGFGLSLVSDFYSCGLFFSGMIRHARYSDTKQDAFRIALQGPHLVRFAILGKDCTIDVLPSGNGYAFFIDAREIGRLRITDGEPAPHAPRGYSQYYRVEAELQCPLKPELALAMLFFPTLKFAFEKSIITDTIDICDRFVQSAWNLDRFLDYPEDPPAMDGATSTCSCFEFGTATSHRYEFRLGARKVCEVCCGASPNPPVRIRGEGMDLTSKFEPNQLPRPGIARIVADTATGAEVLHIILGDDYLFRIVIGDEEVKVSKHGDKLLFYREYAFIAYIARLRDAPAYPDETGQGHPEYRFSVTFRQDIDPKLKLALLAYLLLRF